MPLKRCVVSFADTPSYQAKMSRLEKSVHGVDFLGFTDVKQIDCEPHSVIPYKFKAASIKKARELGYEVVLWCDSPIHVIKSLDQAWEYLVENKYFFFDNIGHSCGKWSNQRSLDYFGVTKEQAMDIKMIMACCMGFNFTDKSVSELADEYYELANYLYPGSWEDHRHDQTVMSFLLWRDGFNILIGQDTFFAYKNHHGVLPISETVCLLSE